MAAPDVGPFTERLYARLPEHLRDADLEQQDGPNGFPLLRFIAGNSGAADDVEQLLDRIDYTGPGDTSDLADPATADVEWLPWLAQFVGAKLPLGLTIDDRRTTIAGAVNGFQAGSRGALAEVAKRALTGGKYVNVTPNLDGDPFRIGLATAEEDTPSIEAVIEVIRAAGAEPSGYDVVVTFYAVSWDILEAAYPTSDDWDAVASWDALEQTRP